jgi:hypothetical protein
MLNILWHTDLFLGNNHKTNKKTTAIARQEILNKQQLNYSNRGTVGNNVFCGLCHRVISGTKFRA